MSTAMALPSIDEQIKALPSDALYEIVDGQVVEIEHMGMLATTFASILTSLINAYAMPKRLGLAISEGLYRFRADRPQRRPDVSFISSAKWPANMTGMSDPPAFHTVPSLVVEVISPSNSAAEIEDKRLEYFEAGVKAVWVVHPIPQTIHVYDSPNDCHVVTANGTLEGAAAIPGFQVKVADIFACMFPTPGTPSNGTP